MSKAVRALLAALFAAVPLAAEAANQNAARPAAQASPGGAAIGECALRYGASLKRIGEESLPALKAASAAPGAAATTAGDPTLPGTLLFVSRPRPRSPDEIAALTAAVALARSRGASAAVVGPDSPWIAQRLREDLSDYLGQKPTPFICNGVKEYVRTLRSYAVRLGPVADRRREWVETQRAGTARSLLAAFEAIRLAKPVAVTAGTAPAGGSTAAQPTIEPVPLGTPDDLVAAVDKLVAAAREAELFTPSPAPAASEGGTPAPGTLDLSAHPVLAKLASEKPLVVSARPLIRDQPVRLKMLGAFADIEMLDYLLESRTAAEDPVAKALDKTLGDIEKAQATDCTCPR